MSTPFTNYTPSTSFQTPTPASKNRGGANAGSKRGRKPKNFAIPATPTPAPDSPAQSTFSPQPVAGPSIPTTLTWQSTIVPPNPQTTTTPSTSTGLLNLPGTTSTTALHPTPVVSMITVQVPAEDEEDDMLPAMADDDYSAQLSFQSQSKDNLKCVVVVLNVFMD
jgi:transcription initiation factor TFIID subunit 11